MSNNKECSEKFLEDLLSFTQQASQVGIWEYDIDTDNMYWSDQLHHMLGSNSEEIEPTLQNLMHHVSEDDKTIFLSQIAKIRQSANITPFIIKLCPPSKKEKYVRVVAQPSTTSKRYTNSITGIFQDVTELQLEKINRDSSNRLKKRLLVLSGKIQNIHNTDDLLISVKDEVSTTLGLTDAWLYSSVNQDKYTVELVGVTGSKSATIKEYGKHLHCYGDPMLMTLVDGNDPVVVEDARVDTRTNKDAVALFQNRTIVNIPMELHYTEVGFLGFGTFDDDSVIKFENYQIDYLHDISILVGTALNRLKAEAELEKEEQERIKLSWQLEQAQKMESIAQLTGGFAHDFNNILTSILGFSEMARQRLDKLEDHTTLKYLDEVILSSSRAKSLINKMLTFSRGGRVNPQSVDLVPLISETMSTLKATLPSSIQVKIEADNSRSRVIADPVALQQVLTNLCINARDAMPGQGQLTIRLEQSEQLGEMVCSSCHQSIRGEYASLVISDTGTGIAGNNLARIFEPFFSSKDHTQGSGMGLAMVHGLMHEFNGHIIVDSKAGEGSSFRLMFKYADIMESQPEEHNSNDTAPKVPQDIAKSNYHLLVVDDESSIVIFMKAMLEAEGYTVTAYSDSVEAFEAIKESPERFDLLITDQSMPNLSGAELAINAMQIKPSLPVILCTGYSDVVDETNARSLGIRSYHQKPINTSRFLPDVETQLGIV